MSTWVPTSGGEQGGDELFMSYLLVFRNFLVIHTLGRGRKFVSYLHFN